MGANSAHTRLFIDHVTQIDCGLLDARLGLVGWTWIVDVELGGPCNADGMLVDFGPAKRLLKQQIEALVDHRLLIPRAAPGLENHELTWTLRTIDNGTITYEGPAESVAIVDGESITANALADWLAVRVGRQLPEPIESFVLGLRDEIGTRPFYNYCHGLAAHDGDCQRLGHGHRATLEIAVDGVDRPDYAKAWARDWQNRVIASRRDAWHDNTNVEIDYRTERGRFRLCIDESRCVLLKGPPTVENIAAHIAETLGQREPQRRFRVRATEGVGKGAIVEHGPNV